MLVTRAGEEAAQLSCPLSPPRCPLLSPAEGLRASFACVKHFVIKKVLAEARPERTI